MQNVYYIDSHFKKEDTIQYILSIRYATDGLSFCIHNSENTLLVFFYQPYHLDSQEAVIAKTQEIITEDELLNLNFKKVYILACDKEKTLIPASVFSKNHLSDMYRLCLQAHKNDTLLYRKIDVIDSYILEALPQYFITFLTNRYPSLYIVNSAYPFIIGSLSNIIFNTHHLFIDIHDRYFDLLLTRNNNILLFNSFTYGSVTDLTYYTLNCLQQCQVNTENLQTKISGNLMDDPQLTEILERYIPNVSVLDYAPLSQLVKNKELNNSSFIHLLNIHKCE